MTTARGQGTNGSVVVVDAMAERATGRTGWAGSGATAR